MLAVLLLPWAVEGTTMTPSAEGLRPERPRQAVRREAASDPVSRLAQVSMLCVPAASHKGTILCESYPEKGGAQMKLRESLTWCPDTRYQVTHLDLRLT